MAMGAAFTFHNTPYNDGMSNNTEPKALANAAKSVRDHVNILNQRIAALEAERDARTVDDATVMVRDNTSLDMHGVTASSSATVVCGPQTYNLIFRPNGALSVSTNDGSRLAAVGASGNWLDMVALHDDLRRQVASGS